jgi:LysM repeat protein
MSYDINSSVLVKSGFDAVELEEACRDKLAGLGQTFFDAEANTGINALYMIAHAAIESAWGTSAIAVDKNNLFGWNANDADPAGDASNFSSYGACIQAWSTWLKATYLTKGGEYFEGPTLHDIFIHYSSSHDTEAQSVANIMNELEVALGGDTSEPDEEEETAAPSEPATVPSQHLYVVGSGDTFDGVILKKFPGTTIAEWLTDNQAKYPSITADHIDVGWSLTVPTSSEGVVPAAAPATSSAEVFHEVVSGDTLYSLSKEYKVSTGQIVAWNQAKYPSIGSGNEDLIVIGWVIRVG